MAFAENLRWLRLEHLLSQRELARRAGLHPVTLTRLEAGMTAPSTRTVWALADVFGVEPRELATPDEVAELRRVLRDAVQTKAADDGGHAAGASSRADGRR